jgi:hypothetical protein
MLSTGLHFASESTNVISAEFLTNMWRPAQPALLSRLVSKSDRRFYRNRTRGARVLLSKLASLGTARRNI